jgi:DNA-binding FrmR family transcriptional regulator
MGIGGIKMDYDRKMKNRVSRIEGQLRGILRMMEEGQDSRDVITQLSAARSAIDRTITVVVSSNLIECVKEAEQNGDGQTEELVKEAGNLLVKSR